MSPPRINGLLLFIADLRDCTSAESEQIRIAKEISKIKKMIVNKSISGYDRKKCCWKLVYCYLLGFEVDFGYLEIVQLMASSVYSEKNAGYVASSLLFIKSSEILTLCVNSFKNDMLSNNENFAALALNVFTFVCNAETTENLLSTVAGLTDIQKGDNPYIRKKAYMCLLKMLRTDPEALEMDTWKPKLVMGLGAETDISCLTAICNLILGFLELSSGGWEELLQGVLAVLQFIGSLTSTHQYCYHETVAPWLQIKILRIIQFLPVSNDLGIIAYLNEYFQSILIRFQASSLPHPQHSQRIRSRQLMEMMNRFNIGHALLFETINTAIHYEHVITEAVSGMIVTKLGSLLDLKEPNIRYITLDTMARMVHDPSIAQEFTTYTNQIILQLKESDLSVKRQALNLLYGLCDKSNWSHIVNELLNVLKGADNTAQEELVFKIAVLVEKNAPDLSWYVDAVFKMFEYAPSCAGDEVWYRVVQVVTGFEEDDSQEDLQEYAAMKAFEYLSGDFVYEPVVKLGSYLLGEFGNRIRNEVSGNEMLKVMEHHFPMLSNATKAMLFVSYAKLANLFPEIRNEVIDILEEYEDSHDVDVQTRACELITVLQLSNEDLEKVIGSMPAYSSVIKQQNPLVNRLKQSGQSRAQARVVLEAAAASSGVLKSEVKPNFLEEEEETEHSSNDNEDTDDESEVSAEISQTNGNHKTDVEQPSAATVAAWRKLCVSKQGIIYESSEIRIAVDQAYKGSMGQLIFKVLNASEGSKIQGLKVTIEPMKAFSIAIQQDGLSQTINYKEVGTFKVAVKSLGPSQEVPEMQIEGKVDGRSKIIRLQLPVIITKFITPYMLTPEKAAGAWSAVGSQNEAAAAGTTAMQFARILEVMKESFNFEAVQVKGTTAFGGVYNAAAPSQEEKPRAVSCICIIAEQGNQLKLAVRTPIPSVSQVLCSTLKSYLIR